MSPSTADFSEILELQQFRKLYEEQEEKIKLRLAEKDEQHRASSQRAVDGRDDQIARARQARIQEMHAETERMRGDYNRLRQEAQEKIDKLMERIKELNQRLIGNGGRS